MIKFVLFIKKIHFVLIFIVLEGLAIHYYANSTNYTKVKLVTASNYVVGGIYSQLSNLNSYFHLKQENQALMEELAALRNQMDGASLVLNDASGISPEDSSVLLVEGERHYEYFSARVVNNSITRQENYITIDRGAKHGIEPNMAIISKGGIAGYVLGCSDNFSVCMSVLNRSFKTSGRIKGGEYFGSIYWDGISYEYVTLSEIPKYAPVEIGDTIVTTDYSSYFPPDLMIGTVESFELQNAIYYDIRVKLHTRMGALNNVLVVKYQDAEERRYLEESLQQPAL